MKTLAMNGKDFADAIKFVAYAIDKKDPREVLHFVHIRRIDDDTVRFETTDGRRLATIDIPATGEADKLLLPPDYAKAIIAAKSPTVTLSLSDDGMLGSDPQVIPAGPMLTGDFPFLDMVTPKAFSLHATFDIKAMKDAINLCKAAAKASPVHDDDGVTTWTDEKRIMLRISQGNIRIGSHVPETPVVDIAANIDIDDRYASDGSIPQTVSFNHAYLAKTLTGLKGKLATMKWNKPHLPICFSSTVEIDAPKLRLLMPIKVQPNLWSERVRNSHVERGLITP